MQSVLRILVVCVCFWTCRASSCLLRGIARTTFVALCPPSSFSSALSIINFLHFRLLPLLFAHHHLNCVHHAHLLSLFPSILMISLPPLCSREQGRHRASCDGRSYPSRPSSDRGQGTRTLVLLGFPCVLMHFHVFSFLMWPFHCDG
jgi:hypothetical protein